MHIVQLLNFALLNFGHPPNVSRPDSSSGTPFSAWGVGHKDKTNTCANITKKKKKKKKKKNNNNNNNEVVPKLLNNSEDYRLYSKHVLSEYI